MEVTNIQKWKDYVPVILDDIISTANTTIKRVIEFNKAGFAKPVCIGVHGIFSGTAELALFSTGAEIITTNTIPHHANRIDISEMIAVEFI